MCGNWEVGRRLITCQLGVCVVTVPGFDPVGGRLLWLQVAYTS